MPYRRSYKARPMRRRGRLPGKRLQRVRKLAGQKPVTWAETLSRNAGSIGKIAGSVATLASLVNAEAKFLDIPLDTTGDNLLTYSQHLTALPQGDTENSRDGNRVLMKDINIDLSVSLSSSDTGATVGIALVMDKKAELGAIQGTANWDRVFNDINPNSFIDKAESDRFIILKKKVMPLTSSGTNYIKRFKYYQKLDGIHVDYNGTNAGDVDQNALFLIGCTLEPHAGTSVNVSLRGNARLNFYDN